MPQDIAISLLQAYKASIEKKRQEHERFEMNKAKGRKAREQEWQEFIQKKDVEDK